jgi:hypothetical protein
MIVHPLTKGWQGIVDDEDSDLAVGYYLRLDNGVRGYVRNRANVARHRIVLSRMLERTLLPHEDVDHLVRRDDEKIVDDRRSNLRLARRSQNHMNRRKRSGTSSRFKGVCFCKILGKWHARIGRDKKQDGTSRNYHIDYYVSELEAARAYDVAALYFFKDRALLNCDLFPDLVTWKRVAAA